MFELIIRNGTIVDGTGKERFPADLGVRNRKISTVDDLSGAAAARELDATGMIVCPGFIDIHSHSDFTLLVDPRAVSSITQGVTLEVFGNCGHGCAPILNPDLAPMNIFGFSADYDMNWRTMGEYLDRLEAEQPAVNVLSLVPNGNLRLAVAGLVDRPSTPDELKEMKKLLEQSLEEGAFGFSTGLNTGPRRPVPKKRSSSCARSRPGPEDSMLPIRAIWREKPSNRSRKPSEPVPLRSYRCRFRIFQSSPGWSKTAPGQSSKPSSRSKEPGLKAWISALTCTLVSSVRPI